MTGSRGADRLTQWAAARPGGVLLTDGAMGTQLQARGLARGSLCAPWTLDRAQAVLSVHRAYVEAGAEVVLTNTFGAARPALAALGLGDRIEELHRTAAAIAREAAGPYGALVAGDIGPLAPDASPEAYGEQATLLVEAGCDLLVFETFTDPAVAARAVSEARGASRAARDVPIVAMVAYPGSLPVSGPRKPTQAAASLVEAGADAVGVNCTCAQRCVYALLELADRPRAPLAVSPSVSGQDGASTIDLLLMSTAPWRGSLVLIGGCCGTSPEWIRAVDDARRRGWSKEQCL